MASSKHDREESIGFQCEDQFVNLERRRDREEAQFTEHTGWSHSRTGSHVLHE